MRKFTHSILPVALLFAASSLFAQDSLTWEDMMLNPNFNFFQVQQKFYEEWEGKPYESGNGYKQFKRWEYLMETTVDSNGFYDNLYFQEEFQKFLDAQGGSANRSSASCSSPNSGGNWSALGPFNQPSGNNGIGRINVIGFHPTNTSLLWAGSASGGLWKSVNGGTTWTTNTDNFQNLGVSDIAIDPTNPNIMYLGTGDRDHSDTYAFGLLKSTDGGLNWSTTSMPISSNNLIHRVLLNPSNTQILLVSTSTGLWRSTNAGTSWTQINSLYFRSMEFKPGDPNIVYAATYSNSQFYRSTDGGVTFSLVSLPAPSSGNTVKRFAIAVTANNAAAVYLLGSYDDPTGDNDFNGIYKSTDSGLTFTQVATTTPPDLGSQQWYDWTVAVSPSNQNELYAGGVGFYKSTNGGVTWVSENSGGGVSVHVDHHFANYQPGSSNLFVGSDGGVFRTPDGGSNWFNLSNGLAITQYYRLGASSLTESLVLNGSQDNGTHLVTAGFWDHVLGGDGMECLISHDDDAIMFASSQNGYVNRSVNGGNNFSSTISPSSTGETGAWVTPYVMDPSNSDILYAGFKSIWKTTNQGNTWTNPFGALTTGNMQHIEVAPSNASVIYATDYSQIWKSTDAGLTWATVADPGSSIRSIAVHASDPNTVWACVSNDIYKSTNGGGSWTNVAGSLPNIPMRSIVYQANANNALYVGSEIGIYFKNDLLADWELFSDALPRVRVDELQIFNLTGKIKAATFGRGLWESELYCTDGYVCSAILDTFPYAEGFETSIGAWVQDTNDDFDWTRLSGPTPTANTGPDMAYEGSFYLYAEATGNTGNEAILISPCVNAGSINSPALYFRYHMFGANIGTLSVELSDDLGNTWDTAWSLSGNQGNTWIAKTIDLSAYGNGALIRFKALIAGDEGDIAVDAIAIREGCGTPIATFPYDESFETGLGAWSQSSEDDIDWTRLSGATATASTGPDAAYDGTYYMYVESSSPNFPNKVAILTGPCFNVTDLLNPTLSFAYHMYGATMGTLALEASTNEGETWTSIWTMSGNKGNTWFVAQISLSAYIGQVVKFRFKGTTGSSFTSDMAIDKVRVFQGGTLPPDCTTLTNPAPGATNVAVTTALTWTAANGAPNGYRLDVGTSPGGTQILNNFDVGNVTTFNPPGDFPQLTVIYVKIKPYNANGTWAGCVEQSFTTAGFLTNPSACLMNLAFPDNSCTVSNRFLINVTSAPGTQLGTDVFLTNVKVIIQHTWDADLDITLYSPNNVAVLLSSDNGASGDNYGDPASANCSSVTDFKMDAVLSVTAGAGPFIGSYIPEGNFALLNGGNPLGVWTLEICDDEANDMGNLDFVELVFAAPPACTNLSSPANGATNVATAAALTWAAASGNPTGYRLDVGTTPGGTDILNNFDVGNVTTYNPPGDFPYNTVIYVKIKPYNAVGSSLNCSQESFTTIPATPACTNLTSPLNGATNVAVTAVLNWAAPGGNPPATGYRLDVGTSPGGTDILFNFDVGNVTTYIFAPNLPYAATIYVKIKPYNASGSAVGCIEESFTTEAAPPNCTSLSSPANGATNVAVTSALTWTAATGNPTGYRLDVGTSSGGTEILSNFDVGNVTTHNPAGDFPFSSMIYVKIKPYNATGSATGCAEESFETEAAPPPNCTSLSSPANGATNVAVTASFNWAAASGNPSGYRLDVGTTSGGTDILNNVDVGNMTSYNPAGDFPFGTTIYVKIKPYNASGTATGCPEESFTTEAPPPPNCTSLTSPANGATNVAITAALTWTAAPGNPTGYRLDIGTSSGGTEILNNFDVGNVTTYLPLVSFPFNTIIYVKIKPYNASGSATGCTEETFTTEAAPPPNCTSLSSPANGGTNVAITTALTWAAASSNPSGYRLDVGTTPGGTDILNNFDVGNVTTFDPAGDFPFSTIIYVKIKPYNASGSATGCAEESFTTEAPPPPNCTNLTSPANGATAVLPTAVLTWAAASGNPTGYRLDVGTTSGGTDILNNVDLGNVTTFDPAGYLPYGSTVFVKIKPYNASGDANNCVEESFTTASCIPNLSIVMIPVPGGSHRSLGELTSHTSTVVNGTDVEFTSDTGVLLEHDFTVELGGLFEIRIQGCPTEPNATGGGTGEK